MAVGAEIREITSAGHQVSKAISDRAPQLPWVRTMQWDEQAAAVEAAFTVLVELDRCSVERHDSRPDGSHCRL